MFESPQVISKHLDSQQLIRLGVMDGPTPVGLITPKHVEVDLIDWATANRALIENELQRHGVLLFRGFGIDSIDRLRKLALSYADELVPYIERRSPRTNLGDKIYTSTVHPSDQYIHYHNTTSFARHWPATLWFACLQPAESGGRTPVSDCRKTLRSLDSEVLRKFRDTGVLYVSNYSEGMGLAWQTTFRTKDRSKVEEYCRDNRIEFEWIGHDQLRTKAHRHAIVEHPRTRELSWFNQAHHFHVYGLEASVTEAMLSTYEEERLPRNAYYGDGSPIDRDTVQHIYQCYREHETSFDWEKGDVLMLDNMMVAHSRTPYRGERLIALALAHMHAVERTRDGIAFPRPSASRPVEED